MPIHSVDPEIKHIGFAAIGSSSACEDHGIKDHGSWSQVSTCSSTMIMIVPSWWRGCPIYPEHIHCFGGQRPRHMAWNFVWEIILTNRAKIVGTRVARICWWTNPTPRLTWDGWRPYQRPNESTKQLTCVTIKLCMVENPVYDFVCRRSRTTAFSMLVLTLDLESGANIGYQVTIGDLHRCTYLQM